MDTCSFVLKEKKKGADYTVSLQFILNMRLSRTHKTRYETKYWTLFRNTNAALSLLDVEVARPFVATYLVYQLYKVMCQMCL